MTGLLRWRSHSRNDGFDSFIESGLLRWQSHSRNDGFDSFIESGLLRPPKASIPTKFRYASVTLASSTSLIASA